MSTKTTPRAKAPVVAIASGAVASGRDRLVVTAMQLFAARGYDGVSIRDIAADAKVSIGLIKHHFGSKEGLRDAVDAYFIARFESFYAGNDALTTHASLDRIAASVEEWIGRIADDWPAFASYFRRALLEQSPWGAKLFKRYFELVRGALDQADARGAIRDDVDRLWLPFLVIYLQTGTLLMAPYIEELLGRSPFDRALWQRRHRAYDALIGRGIAPRKKTRSPNETREDDGHA